MSNNYNVGSYLVSDDLVSFDLLIWPNNLVERTDPFGKSSFITCTCIVPSPTGPASCHPLYHFILLDLNFRLTLAAGKPLNGYQGFR